MPDVFDFEDAASFDLWEREMRSRYGQTLGDVVELLKLNDAQPGKVGRVLAEDVFAEVEDTPMEWGQG